MARLNHVQTLPTQVQFFEILLLQLVVSLCGKGGVHQKEHHTSMS